VQVIIGIAGVAVIAGLIASLWIVVRRSRGRREWIAKQFREEIVPARSALAIGANHKANGAYAVFFGCLMAAAAGQILDGRAALGIALVFVSGGPVFYARRAVRRAPLFVIDSEGISVASSGEQSRGTRSSRFDSKSGRGACGVSYHDLVCDI
jgi:hypothetical protein